MTIQLPMLAVPSRMVAPTPESTVAALHARGDYLWQPKWDGIRALAYVEDGTAWLINRLGVDISDRYPDVIAALAGAYPTESRVFDGELLVFHDGRPEFARVHRRNAQSNARRIYYLTQSDPATFMAFDLLYADGRDLRHDPLTVRLSLLSKMVDDGAHLMISPTSDNGSQLWQIVIDQHLEGVVAKHQRSKYTGRRDPAWVKIKTARRLFAVVTGFEPGKGGRSGHVGALMLSLVDPKGRLVPVGKVGTGIKEIDHVPLLRLLATGKLFVVEVEYQEASSNQQLRFPSLKAYGQNTDPSACKLDQLSY
jgi:bifunctional non-homologous end joining protein LigD